MKQEKKQKIIWKILLTITIILNILIYSAIIAYGEEIEEVADGYIISEEQLIEFANYKQENKLLRNEIEFLEEDIDDLRDIINYKEQKIDLQKRKIEQEKEYSEYLKNSLKDERESFNKIIQLQEEKIKILEDEVDNLQDLRGLSIDNISQLVLVGGAIYLGANLLN